MVSRIIIGLLITQLYCFCTPRFSDLNPEVSSKISIDNDVNRGTSYTTSSGSDFNIRYIPITITNDSIIPMQLHLEFNKAYDHPHAIDNEKFNLVILPREWTDTISITDNMYSKMQAYKETPVLNRTILPGDKLVIAIGTVYPNPALICGILPNILHTSTREHKFPTCESTKKVLNSNSQIGLRLKLDYCYKNGKAENCMIIPCGHITFSDLT